MPSPFVSLNSWVAPGWMYQGEEPIEVIEGGPDDWDRLERGLDRHRAERADASPHPCGAAVGYFEYDGSFWFGIFPELHAEPMGIPTARWTRRSHEHEAPTRIGAWRAGMTRDDYELAVRAVHDGIAAGEVYQVNITQRFAADFEGNPYALFEHLLARSPAPGGAFLDTGTRQILSASPELFLRIEGREILTRPIKGTRPRDRDPQRDGRLAYELITDPKEIAELIMITDLERNDLGRVCEFGSVTVPDLLRPEKFAQVHHLVSTVSGRLRREVTPLQALRACFPGGSITGAPKKTAMETIERLEPCPRGLYTGAIGYFAFNGDAAFSIAIRTLVRDGRELHYHVGSGITADSDPAREFDETMQKGTGIRSAVSCYLESAAMELVHKATRP